MIFPAFSKLDIASENIKKVFQYSVKYTAIVLVPASAFIIAMPRILIEIVHGHEYVLAPLYLSLYAVLYLYSTLGLVVLGSFFSSIGETKVNLKAILIYITMFIPLATILTFLYGVIGLITSILISSLANVIYYVKVIVRQHQIKIDFQSSAKVLVASGIASLTLIPIILNTCLLSYLRLLLGTLVYLTFYITILPLIKGLEKIDVKNFDILLRRYTFLRPLIKLLLRYESKLITITQNIS